VEEHLPSIRNALGSIPRMEKHKQNLKTHNCSFTKNYIHFWKYIREERKELLSILYSLVSFTNKILFQFTVKVILMYIRNRGEGILEWMKVVNITT
jgi:hypothetical protein